MKKTAIILLLFLVSSAFGVVIDPTRLITWGSGNSGVEGGIPNYTTIHQTFSPGATAAQINSAIVSCPADRVVKLDAGTYNNMGGIIFDNKQRAVLRGSVDGNGLPTTRLIFTSAPNDGAIWFRGSNVRAIVDNDSDPANTRNWTAGYTKGTTQVTLSSTTGLQVGWVLVLDEKNDPAKGVTPNGQEGCPYCSRQAGSRSVQQNVKVTAISGNVVTISPPLMFDYNASLSPQAYWWGSSTEMCGVEDIEMVLTNNAGQYGIRFNDYLNCWATNIKTLNGNRAHVATSQGMRAEISHCWFYGSKNAASQSYGVETTFASSNLIVNNIFDHVTTGYQTGSTQAGNVIAYNYIRDNYYTQSLAWMISGMANHAAHNHYQMYEGNYANAINMDDIHGSGSNSTVFRNRLIGWEPPSQATDPAKSMNTIPVAVQAQNRNTNIVGNILGKEAGTFGSAFAHTKYMCTGSNNGNAYLSIFTIGYWNNSFTYPGQYDQTVPDTILIKGNYNTVTNNIPASESFGGDTLPDSLYLASKPSWFGNLSWPPFDPTNPNNDSFQNIPAGYRYANGTDPPAGSSTPTPTPTATATPTVTPTPTATPTPTPVDIPSLPTTAAIIDPPFALSSGTISQTSQTVDPSQAGRARYWFNVPNPANATGYTISAQVNIADTASNSFFVNVDTEPTINNIWGEIQVTSGLQSRTVFWDPETGAHLWMFTPGIHILYVRGREANAKLGDITITAISNPSPTPTPSPTPPAAPPIINPNGGSFVTTTGNITLSTTQTAGSPVIKWWADASHYSGVLPPNAQTYATPFPLTYSTSVTAVVQATGYSDSPEITSNPFEVQVATPVISPAGGTFTGDTVVTITSPADTATYYTLDGSTPTDSSTRYAVPFTINSSLTVKAIAAKRDLTDSAVASASFTINSPSPTPTPTATPTPSPTPTATPGQVQRVGWGPP